MKILKKLLWFVFDKVEDVAEEKAKKSGFGKIYDVVEKKVEKNIKIQKNNNMIKSSILSFLSY